MTHQHYLKLSSPMIVQICTAQVLHSCFSLISLPSELYSYVVYSSLFHIYSAPLYFLPAYSGTAATCHFKEPDLLSYLSS